MALKLSNQIRSKIVDIVSMNLSGTAGTDAGTSGSNASLWVFGGTQPGTAGGDIGTQGTIVRIDGIWWSAGTGGTAVIGASKSGTAGSTGTAVWARLAGSSGTLNVLDGVCGTATNSDFVIDVAAITSGAVVTLSAATLVQPTN